jgi:drug/metabolite transporter (DMT)-like permease
MLSIPANALVALAAAATWGGGDFSGGMGAKAATESTDATTGALRLVIVAHTVSFTVLMAILWWQHARLGHGAPVVWSLAAGVAAGVSLTAFYMALARGEMGVSAAVSGLLAAAIPALVSSFLEGVPGPLRLAGFVAAGAAIWTIAAGPSPENVAGPGKTMGLAIVGGLGFGFYFVGLRMADSLGAMQPVALARAGSLVVCVTLLGAIALWERSSRTQPGPSGARVAKPWLNRTALGWAMGVALLDTGGNLLFVASTRLGRLDVAAVLASLYPASTILLAAWRLHERPTRRQVGGMVLALAAVVMITV